MDIMNDDVHIQSALLSGDIYGGGWGRQGNTINPPPINKIRKLRLLISRFKLTPHLYLVDNATQKRL